MAAHIHAHTHSVADNARSSIMVPLRRRARAWPVVAAVWFTCIVCAFAWERGVDRRALAGVRVLDLRYVPPIASMSPQAFVEALRDTGSFMTNRGFQVPASSEVATHGTFVFDAGIHSARPEAQADVCMMACMTYNALAEASPTTGSSFRCVATTTQVSLNRNRFYVDVGYSTGNLWRGEAMCSSPVPNHASCFLLEGEAADAAFVPVLVTLTKFELAHSSCLLSAHLAPTCPSTARMAAWRPLFTPSGSVAESNAASGQGPACACPPFTVGAQCHLRVDTTCAVPSTTPLLESHCAAASSSVLDGGITYMARACDATISSFTCTVCADSTRYGPLCSLDKCVLLDGSPRCGDRARACVQGQCICAPGDDPTTGCRTCAPGFHQAPGDTVCVPQTSCWSSWDPDDAAEGWFAHGQHGGRAKLCNGHGTCVVPESGSAHAQCACDDLWNGAGCTVDMHACALQGAVQSYRDSVVGACSLTALDKAEAYDACPALETWDMDDVGAGMPFTVPDALSQAQGWKACALLNARLERYEDAAEDGAHSLHCAGVAPPGAVVINNTNVGTHLDVDMVPGPGCGWTASVQHVFGHERSLGMPVRCVGYPCTPPGTFADAVWGELVPLPGVPTLFDAHAVCRGAQQGSVERAAAASNRDMDELQRRQLRGGTATTGVAHNIMWYLDEGTGQLSWREHTFLWVGDADASVGAWQQAAEPSFVGVTGGAYLHPDLGEPNAVPHSHFAACAVHAPYTPGVVREPSAPPGAGGATVLLWLDVVS